MKSFYHLLSLPAILAFAPFGKLKYDRIMTIPQDVGDEQYMVTFQPRLYVYEDLRPKRRSSGQLRHHVFLVLPQDLDGHGATYFVYRYSWQSVVVWFPSKTDLRPYAVRYTGNSEGDWFEDTRWAEFDGHPVFTKLASRLWSDTNEAVGFSL
ncbi:hypothetical protein MRB53_040835 [Persea americana]|nr:hypothetical protein MRB53_040835 [Persea americana]